MNPNQILMSVIDGFDMKPQEVVSLLERVKAEYYIRMYSPTVPVVPIVPEAPAPITLVQTQFPFSETPKNRRKKSGWRWKEEAVDRKIIERKQLSMSPLAKMREKYPDLVYFENSEKPVEAPKPRKKKAKKKYNISGFQIYLLCYHKKHNPNQE